MTENNIKARKEALERLQTVIKQEQERLAHSVTVDPQTYFYDSIIASVNRARKETE